MQLFEIRSEAKPKCLVGLEEKHSPVYIGYNYLALLEEGTGTADGDEPRKFEENEDFKEIDWKKDPQLRKKIISEFLSYTEEKIMSDEEMSVYQSLTTFVSS
ncbi:MAG: hypothetical protein PSN37_04855 [Alphaproteobacteria bacterium]|nr:hypothetical protein [Alphaproteobacteria bacterium]